MLIIRTSIVIFLILLTSLTSLAQPCTTLGQTPSTAFPVCGTDTFSQSTVPYCGGKDLPGPCSRDGVTDLNPFYYKFTCIESGTLGFVITPNDLNDDYDWQIFDITNHSPDDIYTDASLFVSDNWSGNSGKTGTSASANSLTNCAGPAYPTFSKMPALIKGHEYLLMISHFTTFTPSQNGYALSFGGGTASITDTLTPKIVKAYSSCDGKTIGVITNKPMRCASLASDGSDFAISVNGYKSVAASSPSCSVGFDLDTVLVTFDKPLPVGTHTISVKVGSDGNTLLDYCSKGIATGDGATFTVYPTQPTPLDSIAPLTCAPDKIQLVFRNNILCSSIAANGSDFKIAGPQTVNITGASGNCIGGKSNVITLSLSAPLVTGGTYQVSLQQSLDGNTIIDECLQETPPTTIYFSVKDTVSADFTYTVNQNCKYTTVQLAHTGGNGINKWTWDMGYAGKSNLQNTVARYNTYGAQTIKLVVTNGFCTDSSLIDVSIGNELIADFEVSNTICPEDSAVFENKSVGNIISYAWDLGDGNVSSLETPPYEFYPKSAAEKIYTVKLIVKNDLNCFDTATREIKVLKSCYIAVPTAFTPNGDGLNDFLYPLNAFLTTGLDFKVFNRIGQLVFHSTDWQEKWDGTLKGEPQSSGVYVWTLSFTNTVSGMKIFQKGSSILIR